MSANSLTLRREELLRAETRSTGSWGMLLLILTEAALFAVLIASYFYLQNSNPTWPLGGIQPPELLRPGIGTVVLIASSLAFIFGERSIRRGNQGGLKLGLAVSFILGAIFVAIQVLEYGSKTFTPETNAYGSLFFTITGLHGMHVIVGLIMNAVVQVWAWLGFFDGQQHLAVTNTGLYWHFVDAVWLVVFSSLYLSPQFLR